MVEDGVVRCRIDLAVRTWRCKQNTVRKFETYQILGCGKACVALALVRGLAKRNVAVAMDVAPWGCVRLEDIIPIGELRSYLPSEHIESQPHL